MNEGAAGVVALVVESHAVAVFVGGVLGDVGDDVGGGGAVEVGEVEVGVFSEGGGGGRDADIADASAAEPAVRRESAAGP